MFSCEWPVTLMWHLTNRKWDLRKHDPPQVVKPDCRGGTHADDTIYHRHNLCFLLSNFFMKLDTDHGQHPLYSPSEKALNRKEDVESRSTVFQIAWQRSGQRPVNILERCQWIATCSCLLPLYILFLVWNTCSVLYANHVFHITTHHLLHNAAVFGQITFVKHLERLFLSQFWALFATYLKCV